MRLTPMRAMPAFGLYLLLVGCQQRGAAPTNQVAPTSREDAAAQTAPAGTTASPAPGESKFAAGYQVYPTFGLAVRPPEGWHRDAKLPPVGFVGRWLPVGAGEEDWSQFAIDLQPARGKSLRGAAEPFMRQGYASEELQLDGFPALRLALPPAAEDATPEALRSRRLTPSPVVICKRGGLLYRMLFLLDGPEELPLADGAIASWRWRDTAPVVDHLELGDPTPVLENLATLRAPEPARRDLSMIRPGADGLVAFDYRAEQDALLIGLELADPKNGDTLEKQALRYAEQVESRTRLNGMLRFAPDVEKPSNHVWISQPLAMSFQTEAGKEVQRLSVYAVWQPQKDTFIWVQFVVNNEVVSEPDDMTKTLEAVRAIAQSFSGGEEEPKQPAAG